MDATFFLPYSLRISFVIDEYLLVTEYAEGGTLRNYLREFFSIKLAR
jgi:hypothetical protein